MCEFFEIGVSERLVLLHKCANVDGNQADNIKDTRNQKEEERERKMRKKGKWRNGEMFSMVKTVC